MSVVWCFFQVCDDDVSKAQCLICYVFCSRGKSGNSRHNFTTTSLLGHLKSRHPVELALARQQLEDTQKANDAVKRKVQLLIEESNECSFNNKKLKKHETVEPKKKYTSNQPQQIKRKFELLEWLIDAGLPYTVIENARFQHFISSLNSKFDIPSEMTLPTFVLPEMYGRVYTEVKRLIKDHLKYCSLTINTWNASNTVTYMVVTCHFIDYHSWQRKSLILECLPFPNNITAEYLSTALKRILYDFKITSKLHVVVHDNSTHVAEAIQLANFKSVGCFVRALSSIVTNCLACQDDLVALFSKIRFIVRKIRHSTKAKTLLREAQISEDLPAHSLIYDRDKSWSSIHKMAQRFLTQQAAIQTVCSQSNMLSGEAVLTKNEWDLLSTLVKILDQIANAIKYQEKEQSCVSHAVAEAKFLNKAFCDTNPSNLDQLKDALVSKIEQHIYGQDARSHFQSIKTNEIYAMATLLDPRFKKKVFKDQTSADCAELILVQHVAKELSDSNESKPCRENALLSEKERRSLTFKSDYEDDDLQKPVNAESTYERAKSIVSDYIADPRIASDLSPLDYWKLNGNKRPVLAKLALKFLSAPISLVASKYDFKGATIDPASRLRTNRLSDNIGRSLFLKHNLKAIDYHTANLKNNEPEKWTSYEINGINDNFDDSDMNSSNSADEDD